MTIDEARALIPPGWVECSCRDYYDAGVDELLDEPAKRLMVVLCGKSLYDIPAPKQPRRVPMGEMVVKFFCDGTGVAQPDVVDGIRVELGGYDAVANTKWRLDPDAREWVEVMK